MDRLIRAVVDRDSLWRALPSRFRSDITPVSSDYSLDEPIRIVADSLPPSLRAKWSGRLTTMAEWTARRPGGPGVLITLTRVTRVGPFARIGVVTSGITARFRFGPSVYSNITYDLMQLDREWVVVKSVSRGRD